ncbi:MAG: GvpL/GvpF family gas vesicle protein [Anaerolineae bacterium]
MSDPTMSDPNPGDERGLYLYCFAEGADDVSLDCRGLGTGPVRTLARRNLVAVMQGCSTTPFSSNDREEVEGWLLAHQEVVDAGWRRFGTVLPCAFNTIVRARDGRSPEENVAVWLVENRADVCAKLERLRGRAEYGVQIVWEPERISSQVVAEEPELARLEMEAEKQSGGIAYLSRERLKKRLRQALEERADALYRGFYRRIRARVEAVQVGRLHQETGGKAMLMNLSCLLPQGEEERLGSLLDEIDGIEGCSVRFTGPWPPYSFVGLVGSPDRDEAFPPPEPQQRAE